MTHEERFEAFLKQLKESNQFVKENVMCYFYFNTSCCSQCPKRDCEERSHANKELL